jgi:hypothetical protein
MSIEINTLEDQFALIDAAFQEARTHDNPIGVDGLPYLRKENRWWDSNVDVERTVVKFTDVHQCFDEPLSLKAMIAHTKDRVKMSVESDTDTVLLRILIKFDTRRNAEAEPSDVYQDRFLVEFQWVMALGDEPPVILLGGEGTDDDPLADTENETQL